MWSSYSATTRLISQNLDTPSLSCSCRCTFWWLRVPNFSPCTPCGTQSLARSKKFPQLTSLDFASRISTLGLCKAHCGNWRKITLQIISLKYGILAYYRYVILNQALGNKLGNNLSLRYHRTFQKVNIRHRVQGLRCLCRYGFRHVLLSLFNMGCLLNFNRNNGICVESWDRTHGELVNM